MTFNDFFNKVKLQYPGTVKIYEKGRGISTNSLITGPYPSVYILQESTGILSIKLRRHCRSYIFYDTFLSLKDCGLSEDSKFYLHAHLNDDFDEIMEKINQANGLLCNYLMLQEMK